MDADIRINYAGNGNIRKGNYKRAYTYFNIIRKHSPQNIFTRICALLCADRLNMTNESKIIIKEIDRLVKDFGDTFIITMAPVSSTLITDGSSIAGFNYKELYDSPEGKLIHWFNTQCYGSYSFQTYDSIVKNGYPPEKVVMGMESGQFDEKTFENAIHEVIKIKQKYLNYWSCFFISKI